MQNEAIFLIERLLNYYNLTSLQELAEKLNIKQSSLSSWKSRNSINAIKNKCRELGIYNEIFGDLNTNINNQIIRDNHANNTQTGNIYSSKKDENENNLNFDEAALAMFKRAYNKCLDEDGEIIEDKIFELITHLMRFK